MFSCNLTNIFRRAVSKNTYGELLLQIFIQQACHIFRYKFVSNLFFFEYISVQFNVFFRTSSASSSEIFFVLIQARSMWTVFCKVLLDYLFARWCLIKAWLNCCWNCYVAFSLEKIFCNKNSFLFWYLKQCKLEYFYSNIFISILSPELWHLKLIACLPVLKLSC